VLGRIRDGHSSRNESLVSPKSQQSTRFNKPADNLPTSLYTFKVTGVHILAPAKYAAEKRYLFILGGLVSDNWLAIVNTRCFSCWEQMRFYLL
jgi:hypothetical protein